MHPDYFQLSGGLERAIYRIARKHAGDQDDGWTCRVSLLHEKTGSDSEPKEFARMLRRIVEVNDLPEYDVAFTTVGDGSAGVRFIRRSVVERVQLQASLEAEDLARARRELEDRRADEVDGRVEPWAKRRVPAADA
jgi:plasmid replication initiation protein